MRNLPLLSSVLTVALLAIAWTGYAQDNSSSKGDSADTDFHIVVHKSNPTTQLSRSQVSNFLLKKSLN